ASACSRPPPPMTSTFMPDRFGFVKSADYTGRVVALRGRTAAAGELHCAGYAAAAGGFATRAGTEQLIGGAQAQVQRDLQAEVVGKPRTAAIAAHDVHRADAPAELRVRKGVV